MTVLISLLTALAAIIAPVLTAYINRKADISIKKMELIDSKKQDAYISFAKSGAPLLGSNNSLTDKQKLEFQENATSISIYCSEETVSRLRALVKSVAEYEKMKNILSIDDDFFNCLCEVKKELQVK